MKHKLHSSMPRRGASLVDPLARFTARFMGRRPRVGLVVAFLVCLGPGCSAERENAGSDGLVGGGSGGMPAAVGTPGSGGTLTTGGQGSPAGGEASGGTGAAGGDFGSGGVMGGGGDASSGGNMSSGGKANTGGSIGTGGQPEASGGNAGTGGEVSALPETMIFLLLGQSNMVGSPQPQSEDMAENPRIQVMAYDNCSNLGRSYNEWYTASPPLHNCDGGVGPGDYFAKTLLEKLPVDTTIGLVPFAVNGAPIEVFRKGVPRPGWTLPPDDHWETGYEWLISRATEAQKFGTISGILFHQGESDASNAEWPTQVAQLVADLRVDLGIGEKAPFVAGELLATGCCAERNALINEFTTQIPNARVASSSDLAGTDIYHFDLAGQRELGKRYAEQMISALDL